MARARPTATAAARPPPPAHDAVLQALPHPCALYDRDDGHLLRCNPAFERAFGALDEHVSRDALLRRLGVPEQHAPREAEVMAPHSGRWYAVHRGASGDGFELLTAVDVTERIEALNAQKRRQEKLLFTSRLMSVGEMAATLAHELNQPLATIVNYLNGSLRLVAQAGGPVQVERALQAARAQAEHASAVIARVREFVRAREPRRDAHRLDAIAGNVVELLRLEAERLQLRIELALAPDLPAVYADRVMIEQVLLNLVKNAIEAMREVAPLQRALRVEGRVNLDGDVEVRVCDRGPGLTPAEQGQLFSPFFTTKSDGLGIGLAICRSIVEYHEGRLFFEPREGGGSVFGFTLPRAEGRA